MLEDRAERIDELTDQVESLENELDEASSASTTEPTTTTTTTTTTSTTAPTTTAPPTTEGPTETVSRSNARRKAAEYLDFTSFSRRGLIEQLLYDGFTQDQAEHGADSAGF